VDTEGLESLFHLEASPFQSSEVSEWTAHKNLSFNKSLKALVRQQTSRPNRKPTLKPIGHVVLIQ
jgi:hypothetical protein